MRQFMLPDLGEGLEEAEIVDLVRQRRRSRCYRSAAGFGRDRQGRGRGAVTVERTHRACLAPRVM